jgi:excisionase family DNA binding protein
LWAREGRISYLRIGNRLKFRAEQIEAWLRQREVVV